MKNADIQHQVKTNIDRLDRATRRHQQLCYFFLFIFPMSTCYDNSNFATALSNRHSSKWPLRFYFHTTIGQHNCMAITLKCKIRRVGIFSFSSISFKWGKNKSNSSTTKRMLRNFLSRICSLSTQSRFAFRFVLVDRDSAAWLLFR